jgi:ABC-type multidrug transport system permease subunit
MYFTIMFVGQVAAGLGFMLSAACENMEQSSALSSLITLPAILFGGLFVNTSTVFKAIGWVQWLSPIRYGFECLCIAEFKPRGLEDFY